MNDHDQLPIDEYEDAPPDISVTHIAESVSLSISSSSDSLNTSATEVWFETNSTNSGGVEVDVVLS